MSAPSSERTLHPGRRATSHWTRDGRFHIGTLDDCSGCPDRPDERKPRPSGSH